VDQKMLGLEGVDFVDSPLIKIPFSVDRKPPKGKKDKEVSFRGKGFRGGGRGGIVGGERGGGRGAGRGGGRGKGDLGRGSPSSRRGRGNWRGEGGPSKTQAAELVLDIRIKGEQE
jgi:hypothetical protein